MSSRTTSTQWNYYAILQLPQTREPTALSKNEVKTAYHRALLLHHPDKAKSPIMTPASSTPSSTHPQYSIDQILTAYQTLSNPTKRAAYDEGFIAHETSGAPPHHEKATHLGVETFDLEDLDFDEEKASWQRGCRCGNDGAFAVTEYELERESQHGEIYLGCKGCSLFIKVLFGVTEDENALKR